MYDIGDLGKFTATFRDPDTDALVDPATVKFKHKTPAAVETTLTYPDVNLVKLSTGRYRASVSLATAGQWTFRWETTGTYQGAEEFARTVQATVFA